MRDVRIKEGVIVKTEDINRAKDRMKEMYVLGSELVIFRL